MSIAATAEKHSWWNELRHGGMLISPPVLEEFFPEIQKPSAYAYHKLRDGFTSFNTWLEKNEDISVGDAAPLYRWLDTVLEVFLEHKPGCWLKGSKISSTYITVNVLGEQLRANRVLFLDPAQKDPLLFVYVDRTKRVGIGKGRTGHSKLLELLRATGIKLGLLTNGSQFRLCYAGLDHDSWVEWEAETWFDEGELRSQLDGLNTLLGPYGLTPREGVDFPLLRAVENSRVRQGDLSSVLGEQVREAVEDLLREYDAYQRKYPEKAASSYKMPEGDELSEKQQLDALYQAATRLVMRLVVILFAESRGLLPRDLAVYNDSYGLEGLFERLRLALAREGERTLSEQHGAWPRILALFRLVYDGSGDQNIPVRPYEGALFREGDPRSNDPILKALALLEDPDLKINDLRVYRVLERLKIGRLKIKRGRSAAWVKGPVDFSGLRTEYIGIMYEGLLDYQLRAATEPVVFLNIGNEPALPLGTLEQMNGKELKELLQKLAKDKEETLLQEEAGEEEDEQGEFPDGEEEIEEPDSPDEEDEVAEAVEEETDLSKTEADLLRERAFAWALRAVEAGGLVKKPRGKKQDHLYYYEKEKEKRARLLVKKVLAGGEYYLVRSGGNRKGTGTFYTKPGLAVPTVHRTLEPLVYARDENNNLVPREPEEILGLKICDPACGSASFLVAALIYLTEGLFRSIIYYRKFKKKGRNETAVLPLGRKSRGDLVEETIPVPPEDERFTDMLKVRLKRFVVEHCIYGLDINPMAVELARLSLWVETLDYGLPFGFLDHKIKVGNSLVGCWLDRFREYPALAWVRDGGDAGHTNGVHYQKNQWSKAIKEFLNTRVKPELVELIESMELKLEFSPEKKKWDNKKIKEIYSNILPLLEELRDLPVSVYGIRQREVLYREKVLGNPDLRSLKEAFDTWCALWFWPADWLDEHTPGPKNCFNLSGKARQAVRFLAGELKFFHWELEFPEVFASGKGGFDAVLGNPPWDISKPNSKEFFSTHDPIYRTYGKQEAVSHQERLFEIDPVIEREWLSYSAQFRAMSNWAANAARPYGDGKHDGGERLNLMPKAGQWRRSDELHRVWRQQRVKYRGYADPAHPFRHQGSADINKYKLFMEISHSLLRDGGRLGMLVPSGIYTDNGTTQLRKLFLEKNQWEWVFGFENRKGIFNIHRSYKFCPVIVVKSGKTKSIKTSFMRHDLIDWEDAEKSIVLYPREQVEQFSPHSFALLEIQSTRDLEIVEKIYENSILLSDQSADGWGIQYSTEFHMTNDSQLFPPRPKWESKGYVPDIYGRWIGPDGDIAFPFYQGVMIWQFDFSAAEYISGAGNRAKWNNLDWNEKKIIPQFLMGKNIYDKHTGNSQQLKLVFRDITNATNERTMVSTVIPNFPAGNKAPLLKKGLSSIAILPFLNSLVFDYCLRQRLGGTSLNYFILEEMPLIPKIKLNKVELSITTYSSRLSMSNHIFSPYWLLISRKIKSLLKFTWKSIWSITQHERLRLRCILDAIVAGFYGLDYEDLAWILREDPSDPKGFWRVDKDKPKELRHTTLTLVAFKHLKEVGLEQFCQEDWQLPEEVAARLGPRFLPWQLEGTPEESWAECHRHARNILGEEGYKKFLKELEGENKTGNKEKAHPKEKKTRHGQLTLDDMFDD